MALYKIKDFDPDYRKHFDNQDVIGHGLYSGEEKIGSVDDLLVDDSGRFRYFVVNTGAWIFGKKVLLPIGRARISSSDRRVYVNGITKEQVENLPEYNSDMTVDSNHEERVRGVYRSTGIVPGQSPVDAVRNTPGQTSVDAPSAVAGTTPVDNSTYNRDVSSRNRDIAYNRDTANVSDAYTSDAYTYDRDPDLYNMTDRDHQNLRLYEERLVADKTRQKTGEVVVGKRTDTERATASVPIEKERVVVERNTPADAGTVAAAGADAFRDGEVARMDIYEEVPDIHKETVVREDVSVRKAVDRQTVDADEQVRRERLDVRTEGNPVVEKRPQDLD